MKNETGFRNVRLCDLALNDDNDGPCCFFDTVFTYKKLNYNFNTTYGCFQLTLV